jgi:geranylgeranyl diphosphate synthase type I
LTLTVANGTIRDVSPLVEQGGHMSVSGSVITEGASALTSRYAAAVSAELRSAVGRDPLPLYAMIRYHLGWEDAEGRAAEDSGKGLRPILCLMACEATGGDWQQALPAAASLELLHNFSLIHDDIQDQSDRRRHRPTVWTLWGAAQGINAGDGLFALAQREVLRLRETTSSQIVIDAAQVLNEAVMLLCEGQYLDISFESRRHITLEEYLAMVERKAGVLMGASTEMGAVVSGNEEVRESLRRFGTALGVAFQMRDDILGLWGDESVTGKSAESDIKQRKKSLPIVWAMDHAAPETIDRLYDIYDQAIISNAHVAEVLRLLDQSGARQASEAMVLEYSDRALEALDGLALAQGPAEAFASLARSLAQRDR